MEEDEPIPHRRRIKYAYVFWFFIACFILSMFFPPQWRVAYSDGGYMPDVIMRYNPLFYKILFRALLVFLLAGMAYGVWILIAREGKILKLVLWTFLVASVGLAALAVQGFKNFLGSGWYVGQTLTASDGRAYALMGYSLMQAREVYIARRQKQDFLFEQWTPLIRDNEDWPSTNAILVRPAGFQAPGQFFEHDQAIFHLYGENGCKLYYDLKTGQGETDLLDPFVLVGDDDELNPEDVKNLEYYATHPKGRGFGPVAPSAIRKGLDHPNARVRELASKLLDLAKSNPAEDAGYIIRK